MPEFLVIKDVAKTLRVCENTVRSLVTRGELVGYKIGSQLRFNASDVEAFLHNSKTINHGGYSNGVNDDHE
jgi:excisionase family DNA binding protein